MLGNQISLTNNVAKQVVSVTATQNQTDFTVQGGYRINQLGVYRNGVRLVDGRDFLARNGSSVTLVSQGANAGDAMEFVVFDDFRVADALSVNSGGTVNAAVNIKGSADQPTLTYDGSGILKVGDTAVELAIGRENANPFGSYLQARASNGAARDILLNPVGGDVGIGTDNPATKFEVAGTGSPSIRVKDLDGTNQFGQIFANNGTFVIESRNDTSDGQIIFRGRDNTGANEYARFDENGHLGIGTDNPQSGKLHVAGSIRTGRSDSIREGGAIVFERAADGALAYEIDVYGDGTSDATNLRIVDSVLGLERATVSAGGSVGIGTTIPSGIFEVATSVDGEATLATFKNTSGGGTNETVDIKLGLENTVASNVILRAGKEGNHSSGSAADNFFAIHTTLDNTSSEKLRVTSDGNVTINSGAILRWGSSDSATITGNEGGGQSGYLAFSPNNEKVRILATGRTGIGTTNPESILNLFGQGGTTSALGNSENIGATLVINDSGAVTNSGGCIRFGNIQSVNAGSAGMAAIKALLTNGNDNTVGDLAFSTRRATTDATMTESMRINNLGRILIGRAISDDPWTATGNVDAGQYFGAGDNFGAAINSRNIPLILNRTNTTGTIQEFKYNGSITGYITTSASAITITYSSDYRLKENVIPLADAITRVKQLQPKRFNYIIDPDLTVDGFLAHEAQTVVPEAVVGTHNQVDDNGDPVYQGIDPSKMIPLLTAALQEAITKIETLETKVAALEGS